MAKPRARENQAATAAEHEAVYGRMRHSPWGTRRTGKTQSKEVKENATREETLDTPQKSAPSKAEGKETSGIHGTCMKDHTGKFGLGGD